MGFKFANSLHRTQRNFWEKPHPMSPAPTRFPEHHYHPIWVKKLIRKHSRVSHRGWEFFGLRLLFVVEKNPVTFWWMGFLQDFLHVHLGPRHTTRLKNQRFPGLVPGVPGEFIAMGAKRNEGTKQAESGKRKFLQPTCLQGFWAIFLHFWKRWRWAFFFCTGLTLRLTERQWKPTFWKRGNTLYIESINGEISSWAMLVEHHTACPYFLVMG